MKKFLPLLNAAIWIWPAVSLCAAAGPGKPVRSIKYCLSCGPRDSLLKVKTEPAQPVKICACQVLQLESSNHRARNFALFAERTNRKTYSYDVHKAKWLLEKEKRHLSDFFYDKLNVLDDFVEVTDCRSLFAKLKKKHRTLILYDILDADCKR